MSKEKKHKKKKTRAYSVFAPVFPSQFRTPKTDYSSKNVNGNLPNPGSGSGPGPVPYGGYSGGPGGGEGGSGMTMSIPPSRRRVIHEMRSVFGQISEGDTQMTADPAWKGYSAPSPALNVRQGGPQPAGAGFQPVAPGQGGRYDFQRSPGIGFRTEKAWKVWSGIVDILQKRPTLPIHAVMQAAMARAGAKFGDIDPSERRLLEMGIEWYLGDVKNQPKDSDGGGQSGIGAAQLNTGPVT